VFGRNSYMNITRNNLTHDAVSVMVVKKNEQNAWPNSKGTDKEKWNPRYGADIG